MDLAPRGWRSRRGAPRARRRRCARRRARPRRSRRRAGDSRCRNPMIGGTLKRPSSTSGAAASTSSRSRHGATTSSRNTLASGNGWVIGSTPSRSSSSMSAKWSTHVAELDRWPGPAPSSVSAEAGEPGDLGDVVGGNAVRHSRELRTPRRRRIVAGSRGHSARRARSAPAVHAVATDRPHRVAPRRRRWRAIAIHWLTRSPANSLAGSMRRLSTHNRPTP